MPDDLQEQDLEPVQPREVLRHRLDLRAGQSPKRLVGQLQADVLAASGGLEKVSRKKSRCLWRSRCLRLLDLVARLEVRSERSQQELQAKTQTLKEVERAMCCPVTREAFAQPVIASDGHTYDREGLYQWIRGHSASPSSPMTREPLKRNLVSNLLARSLMSILKMPCRPVLSGDIENGLVEDSPWALMKHIRDGNSEASLALLQQDRLSCLDKRLREGQTVLHAALQMGLPQVALAIIEHPEFQGINARDTAGATALHLAAKRGLLPVCEAICNRQDFHEIRACAMFWTARQMAQKAQHDEIAVLLQRRENEFWAERSGDPWGLPSLRTVQLFSKRSFQPLAVRPPRA